MLAFGLLLVLVGGRMIHAGEAAVQSARDDHRHRELQCEQEKKFFCPNWDFSGLAGHGIGGSVLIVAGAAGLISGVTLTVVGAWRRSPAQVPVQKPEGIVAEAKTPTETRRPNASMQDRVRPVN